MGKYLRDDISTFYIKIYSKKYVGPRFDKQ